MIRIDELFRLRTPGFLFCFVAFLCLLNVSITLAADPPPAKARATTRAAQNNAPPPSIIEALNGTDKDAISQALDQICDAAGKRGHGYAGCPASVHIVVIYGAIAAMAWFTTVDEI